MDSVRWSADRNYCLPMCQVSGHTQHVIPSCGLRLRPGDSPTSVPCGHLRQCLRRAGGNTPCPTSDATTRTIRVAQPTDAPRPLASTPGCAAARAASSPRLDPRPRREAVRLPRVGRVTLESGSRFLTGEDLVALADLFEVSTDDLLGRALRYATAGSALVDMRLLESLAAAEPTEEFDGLISGTKSRPSGCPFPMARCWCRWPRRCAGRARSPTSTRRAPSSTGCSPARVGAAPLRACGGLTSPDGAAGERARDPRGGERTALCRQCSGRVGVAGLARGQTHERPVTYGGRRVIYGVNVPCRGIDLSLLDSNGTGHDLRRVGRRWSQPLGAAVGHSVAEFRKTYSNAWLTAVRSMLRRSRARREFQNLRAMAAAGVPCVHAVSVTERRRLGCVVSSTIQIEHLEGGQDLARCLHSAPHRERLAFAEALGRLLARMHAAGYRSTTLSPRNVMVMPAAGSWPQISPTPSVLGCPGCGSWEPASTSTIRSSHPGASSSGRARTDCAGCARIVAAIGRATVPCGGACNAGPCRPSGCVSSADCWPASFPVAARKSRGPR